LSRPCVEGHPAGLALSPRSRVRSCNCARAQVTAVNAFGSTVSAHSNRVLIPAPSSGNGARAALLGTRIPLGIVGAAGVVWYVRRRRLQVTGYGVPVTSSGYTTM
jgi:hypothetical protein